MRLDLRSFMPNRISGQMALIVVASLAVIHVVLTTAFLITRTQSLHDRPFDEIVTLARLIDATPSAERGRLVMQASAAFPSLALAFAPTGAGTNVPQAVDMPAEAIERHLGPGFKVTRVAPTASEAAPRIAVHLRDGAVVTARIGPPAAPMRLGSPVMLTILFIAISVTCLGLWAARVLTEPLRRFAAAAENFEPDGDVAPLPERGPAEIRAAARALNRMRARIKELVAARTHMLAAVSHDLRTPITRLRLRGEYIDDPALRAQVLGELAHMNTMVESILIYLRGSSARGPATMVDIATIAQTVADQYADMGHAVGYHGPDHLVLAAHPEELRRAIANLVDNAVRHGRDVAVRLVGTPTEVSIAVEDDGPGIVDVKKDAMQQPFVRGDAARGMNDSGGFGLGLSITRAVAQAHGGTLALVDRVPTGLIARITLSQSSLPSADEAA